MAFSYFTTPPCRSILDTNSRTFGRKSEKCRVEQAILSVSPTNTEWKILSVHDLIWDILKIKKMERNLFCHTI